VRVPEVHAEGFKTVARQRQQEGGSIQSSEDCRDLV